MYQHVKVIHASPKDGSDALVQLFQPLKMKQYLFVSPLHSLKPQCGQYGLYRLVSTVLMVATFGVFCPAFVMSMKFPLPPQGELKGILSVKKSIKHNMFLKK